MKGIVWGPTFEIANEKLNSIKQDYLLYQHTIEYEVQSKYRHIIVFDNGDIWRAINASECHRAERANLSYIHRSLLTKDNPDYLPGMIRNCTYAQPWHGYCLYG